MPSLELYRQGASQTHPMGRICRHDRYVLENRVVENYFSSCPSGLHSLPPWRSGSLDCEDRHRKGEVCTAPSSGGSHPIRKSHFGSLKGRISDRWHNTHHPLSVHNTTSSDLSPHGEHEWLQGCCDVMGTLPQRNHFSDHSQKHEQCNALGALRHSRSVPLVSWSLLGHSGWPMSWQPRWTLNWCPHPDRLYSPGPFSRWSSCWSPSCPPSTPSRSSKLHTSSSSFGKRAPWELPAIMQTHATVQMYKACTIQDVMHFLQSLLCFYLASA